MRLAELPFPRIDPVAIDLPGPIDVRWYGLMYIAGFAAAHVIVRHLSRQKWIPGLEPARVDELVTVLALSAIVGGRVGYLVIYDLPNVLASPLEALRFWEGGMSFHGGVAGVALAALWFARRRGVRLAALADALALAAPPGLFAVRLTNFINGELYGRVADPQLPWGVRFPTDPRALELLGSGSGLRQREEIIQRAYDTGQWDAIRSQVPLRHPSQLYEAVGEGLLLAIVLWLLLRRRVARTEIGSRPPGWSPLDGAFAALFLMGYAAVRFVVEFFRQPDAQFRGPGDPVGLVLGPFTMGQVISIAMLATGLMILFAAHRRRRASDIPGDARGDIQQ